MSVMIRHAMSKHASLNALSLHSIYEDKIYQTDLVALSWIPSMQSKPSKAPKFSFPSFPALPKLEKRDAVHVKEVPQSKTDAIKNTSKHRQDKIKHIYTPDYTIIDNYGKYSYLQYSKIVNKYYIETEMGNYAPSVITDLCYKYLFIEKDGIFQLAHSISKIVSANVSNNNINANNNRELVFSLGFTGVELINKMRNCIHGFKSLSKTDILNYCNLLIRNKYIRPINSSLLFGGCYDTNINNINRYELNQKKANLFSDYKKFKAAHDRVAWNIGTIVEINSVSNGWSKGQIVDISHKKKKITIVFATKNGQILRKSVHRFDFNKVRSTTQFINDRMAWDKNTQIEIYSHSKHQWCKGIISSISTPNVNKSYMDDIHVVFDNEIKSSKRIARWSCDIRNISELHLNGYRSGSKVKIWSKSAAKWIVGHVKVCIPMVKCVIVKYARSEKIIQATSNEVQLI